MLTKQEILMRMGGDIQIEPFDPKAVNPNSVNLRIGDELLIYEPILVPGKSWSKDLIQPHHIEPLDMKKDNPYSIVNIPADGYVLHPGELYLAKTHEWTSTKNLVPCLAGRSSVGRLGLSIHVTACFGDVGFTGYWTLELFVIRPLRIYPFIPICQIYYEEVVGVIEEYKGKYQDNRGIQSSQLFKELNSAT